MNRTTKGAAPRAAKTTTTILDALITAQEASRNARRAAAREKVANATADILLDIDAHTYGILCAGAVVHGTDIETVAAQLLQDQVCEWANADYAFRD